MEFSYKGNSSMEKDLSPSGHPVEIRRGTMYYQLDGIFL